MWFFRRRKALRPRQLDCSAAGMDLRTTIAELYAEKTRIDQVIASLEQLGDEPLPVSITAPRRGRKFMSPQERREVSERMRRYWAGRKAGENLHQALAIATASAA